MTDVVIARNVSLGIIGIECSLDMGQRVKLCSCIRIVTHALVPTATDSETTLVYGGNSYHCQWSASVEHSVKPGRVSRAGVGTRRMKAPAAVLVDSSSHRPVATSAAPDCAASVMPFNADSLRFVLLRWKGSFPLRREGSCGEALRRSSCRRLGRSATRELDVDCGQIGQQPS